MSGLSFGYTSVDSQYPMFPVAITVPPSSVFKSKAAGVMPTLAVLYISNS